MAESMNTTSSRIARTTGRNITGTIPKTAYRTASASRREPATSKHDEPASPRKPKLTASDLLSIWDRLMIGDYQKNVGINQFYQEKVIRDQTNPPCKQNLQHAFSKTESPNHAAGATGDESSSSEFLIAEVQRTNLEFSRLPYYLKDLTNLIVVLENSLKGLEVLATTNIQMDFAKRFPQEKILNTLRIMDKTAGVLKKANKMSPLEFLELFGGGSFKQAARTDPTRKLRYDNKNHEKFANAVIKSAELVVAVKDAITKINASGIGFDKMQEKMDKLIKRIEASLQNYEGMQRELREICKKLRSMDSDPGGNRKKKKQAAKENKKAADDDEESTDEDDDESDDGDEDNDGDDEDEDEEDDNVASWLNSLPDEPDAVPT